MPETLVIPARFNGPPGSANGGYFAGRVAELLGRGSATVTLRRPVPLDTELDVVRDHDGLRVLAGDVLVAEAAPGAVTAPPVPPVPYNEAAATANRYGGLRAHPFPTCFTCGPARDDGLGLRPGTLADRDGMTAAAWTPGPSVADSASSGGASSGSEAIPVPVACAALDCPGGWTVDLVGRPMVLGRMTVDVASPPLSGERCTIMGRLDGRDGRKAFTSTTLYGEGGRILGSAQATWIELEVRRPE